MIFATVRCSSQSLLFACLLYQHARYEQSGLNTGTADALGLTITDNGAGYAFIKRIKEGSVIDTMKHIQVRFAPLSPPLVYCVGDHIEKINDERLVGRRHFEVAKLLKEIPRDSTFIIRLIEPLKDGFINVGPKGDSRKNKKANYGTGKETLRFNSNGKAEIRIQDDTQTVGIENINNLLESFMGINDAELATEIWELSTAKTNSMDFAEAIDNSELEEFGFTDDFIIELWGVITDARAGRLK
uniref:(California timema) hypothetical protein n=1 Tax=Timema californicum TaxID=61474 RepID=A0A7R9P9U3_TIMCA|nr:unnamed protein product [Timema californicum]